jgi:hypothetical protein
MHIVSHQLVLLFVESAELAIICIFGGYKRHKQFASSVGYEVTYLCNWLYIVGVIRRVHRCAGT